MESRELIISYPLHSSHNLAYETVNLAVVNGYDIMRPMGTTLQILVESLDLKRSITVVALKLLNLVNNAKGLLFLFCFVFFF